MNHSTRASWLALGLALTLAGCDQPTGSTRPKTRAIAATPDELAAPDPAPAPPPPPTPPVGPRPILGQRTTEVRDMAKEQKAGAIVKDPKITAKDPILLIGNAYVSIVSRAAQGNMTKAIDLYQAETGEYPKTYAEFQEKILKPNNIALPMLPFYQEYGYDAPNHKLIILEYPDRKEQANYPK